VSCITSTGPLWAAMRLTVSSICGVRMAWGLAFGLSNNRYAACVLAQSPHASLIGAVGEVADCCAVLIKRRFKRLSCRSARANSCCTHSTDCVPASMIACTSASSYCDVFATQSVSSRRYGQRRQIYRAMGSVFSALCVKGRSWLELVSCLHSHHPMNAMHRDCVDQCQSQLQL